MIVNDYKIFAKNSKLDWAWGAERLGKGRCI